jgi:CRISPR-associated protein Cmr6
MMKPIPDAYQKVPMMFRAQIPGRSQLQYLDPEKRPGKARAGQPQDVELYVDEWVDKAELLPDDKVSDVQSPTYGAKSYKISWRFVTNGGQDDGIVRPVTGANGIPFFPGSSMKGAFRHACEYLEKKGDEKVPKGTTDRYCGNEEDVTPGILRFLGAYPTNDWTERLLDLVHPQQGWQVKSRSTHNKPGGESAYAQVSLYQPTLRFAISSAKSLTPEEWEQVWYIWEKALGFGLGSKVSNGYGQIAKTSYHVLYKSKLRGQGQAAKLIDDTGEFRHNIFRAAIRGHALRIFGGLTDAKNAETLVSHLFGGIQTKEPIVGLLGLNFRELNLDIDSFGAGRYAQPTYNVDGILSWFLTRPLPDSKQEEALKALIAKLVQFALVFGGFGKSWRRVDHRKFYEEYYEDSHKGLIGCHWEWLEDDTKLLNNEALVNQPAKLKDFIEKVRQAAKTWIDLQHKGSKGNGWAKEWREAWHPSNVQVWCRIADNQEDSVAVEWFHRPYDTDGASIKKSSVTGKLGQISRIWHRMYPIVLLQKNPDNPKRPIVKPTPRFLEILTIFPDDSDECLDFIDFLEENPDNFQLVWGNKSE